MTLASSKSFTYPVIFGGPVYQCNLAIMNIIIFVSDKKLMSFSTRKLVKYQYLVNVYIVYFDWIFERMKFLLFNFDTTKF